MILPWPNFWPLVSLKIGGYMYIIIDDLWHSGRHLLNKISLPNMYTVSPRK